LKERDIVEDVENYIVRLLMVLILMEYLKGDKIKEDEMRDIYKTLLEKPERSILIGRDRLRLDDNVKVDLKEK
jgi:hypothetical protein